MIAPRSGSRTIRLARAAAGALFCCCASAVHAANDVPPAPWRVTGVGSCTAAGCHGSGHAQPIVGSEYNAWITRDPHARAYSVLFDQRSQRMVELLGGAVAPAHEDPRCLACHSTTDAPPRDPLVDVVSDGVGCESCHGPAEGYLAVHYEHRLNPDERARLGLWDTDRLLVRTQVCVRCHVGGTGRDVNHDLLAAGHPRLQFEMGAYYEALPKHWDDEADRERFGPDYDALVWAIGQACTSQAALTLLADRAMRGPNWPEFAEWSCAACHHDLRDDDARQQRLADERGLSGQRIDWDTWNHATTLRYAGEVGRAFGISSPAAEQVEARLRDIDSSIRQLTLDRRRLAAEAREAAALVGSWAAALEHASLDRTRLDQLTRSMLAGQRARGVDDWSAAVHIYDSLASQHETRLRYAATRADERLTRAIRQLYGELAARYRAPRTYRFEPARVDAQLAEIDRLLAREEDEP